MATGFSDLGRLAEPAMLVLISLAGGDKHGYAIMQDVEALCGARLGPGTLYVVLPRLESRGWIEALPSDDRRRPYCLTSAGAAVLHEQLTGLSWLATTGLRRLAVT